MPHLLFDALSNAIEQAPERPTWDEYFMATAILVSSRSPCARLRVGCVLVTGGAQKNRMIAAGYNGFLPGAPHTSRVRDDHELGTVHAEQNAVTDAARRGVSLEGSIGYLTHYPCIHCAKILIAAGVTAIKYHSNYKNDPLVAEILAESGLAIVQL